MIFLGDFVFPFDGNKNIYEFTEELTNESKFLNLEGAIIDPEQYTVSTKGMALHSSEYAYDILKSLNVKAVGLANNHIFDYKIDIKEQRNKLNDRGIIACGAGKNIDEALQVALVEDCKYQYAILSFGWNVIGCQYADFNQPGVAPLIEEIIIDSIVKTKNQYEYRKIIVYLHWNYEFEYYPQPADRKLAFSAIEAGADAVIGHHAHIVGVYEFYQNKPIFYSLGNFFMPTQMGFGVYSKIGLCVKYNEEIDAIVLYWIENHSDKLRLMLKEDLTNTKKLESITHIYQDNLIKYAQWFKKNRRKKKLLPIYYKHDQSLKNNIIYWLLKLRNYIVHKITVWGLRKRNN